MCGLGRDVWALFGDVGQNEWQAGAQHVVGLKVKDVWMGVL